MSATIFRHVTVGMMSAAAAFAIASGTAEAQPTDQAAGDGIVVVAPRSLPVPVERSSFSGAPTIVITVSIPVFYGDLDLAKPESRTRLMTRINRVAHDACEHLDRLYPLSPDATCIDKAIANATTAANAVIVSAGG